MGDKLISIPTKFKPEDHLIQLKGKDYLEVKWRVVWFRQDHPEGFITTQLITHDPEAQWALFKAIVVMTTGGEIEASAEAHGSESIKDFRDYIEKAETKAIGRALAMLGYGTQFTGESEADADRPVDAPVEKPKRKASRKQTKAEAPTGPTDAQAHEIKLHMMNLGLKSADMEAICKKLTGEAKPAVELTQEEIARLIEHLRLQKKS